MYKTKKYYIQNNHKYMNKKNNESVYKNINKKKYKVSIRISESLKSNLKLLFSFKLYIIKN